LRYPARLVADLPALVRRIPGADVEIVDDEPPRDTAVYAYDPFCNRPGLMGPPRPEHVEVAERIEAALPYGGGILT
jgi:hypothetical protein